MILSRLLRLGRQIAKDLLWRSLRPSHLLGSGLRVEVRNRADWMLFNDIFVEGEYDPAISLVLADRRESPLVLDLGANVGYFSLRFADRWLRDRGGPADLRIFAVEAVPSLVREYERRLGQPRLEGRVSCRSGLAGRRTGEASVTLRRFHAMGSIVRTSRWTSRLRAPYLDLERLLPPGEPIALLKCDIEGAEEELLETYPDLLRRVEHAVFELHPGVCDVSRCLALLEAAGLAPVGEPRGHGTEAQVQTFSRIRDERE